MRSAILATIVLAPAIAGIAGIPDAKAANARQPYSNIDRRVDAGNDTGNAETERLNAMQLNGGGAPAYPGTPVAPPAYYPQGGNYPPPEVYPQPGYGPAYPPRPGYVPQVYPPSYYPPRY